MAVLDSLKEHVKELYHGGIRTAGKYIVPASLVLAVGCSTPALTPTPPPSITCERSGTETPYCEKNGQRILSFSGSGNILLGNTANFNIYVSREISDGDKVKIMYKTPGFSSTERKRELLAIIPTNAEVRIPFKPEDVGWYTFFIPDIDVEVRKREFDVRYLIVEKGYTKVLLNVDKTVVNVYEPVRISGKIEPPLETRRGSGWGELSIWGNGLERWRLGEIDETLGDGEFNFQWIPNKPGEYRIELKAEAPEHMRSQTNKVITVN